MDRFDLTGKVAIITGGGTGIGRGTALVLAEHGADVVLAGRRPEPLESTARRDRGARPTSSHVPTDVTDPDACQRARRHGRRASSDASTFSSTTPAAPRRNRSRSGPTTSGTRSSTSTSAASGTSPRR